MPKHRKMLLVCINHPNNSDRALLHQPTTTAIAHFFINLQQQRSPFILQPVTTAITIYSSTCNHSDRALFHQSTKTAIAIYSSTYNHNSQVAGSIFKDFSL
ncbi:hypothetical protein [Calothrix sp. 336/3]|uniref:hypothetical protein n=1 Tax=Calothrix sp. 336/3 TaxID=1337936 RepID=UPI00118749B4|nr:hypothetical protein [Calothrix sp. 336/3]